jgi:glycosyltransferase involved in cell wall biosynthesis
VDNIIKGLSVVIPVYNSSEFIVKTLDSILKSARFAKLNNFEIIVVNDGSTDNTGAILANYEDTHVTTVNQLNQGRKLARLLGLKNARFPLALLIDSRVELQERALKDVLSSFSLDERTVISGPTRFPENERLLGIFWETISRIFWFRFYRSEEDINLTLENFDRYPKGTTCLLIPTDLMLQYSEASSSKSHFPSKFQNDDTAILREIVPHVNFIISRKLDAIYFPRVKLSKFFSHSIHRGGVFLDGYINFFKKNKWFLIIGSVIGVLMAWFFLRFLLFFIAGLLIFMIIFLKIPIRNIMSLILFSPVFLIGYGIGFINSLIVLRKGR